MSKKMEVRVKIEDAIAVTLKDQSMQEWLTDYAEDMFPNFRNVEVESTDVHVDVNDFVVIFTVADDVVINS